MNPALSLLIWFIAILIVFFIFWYLAGYSAWGSFVMAVLISLIVLVVLFPWNFGNHHNNVGCDHFGTGAFYGIVLISITILLAYIVITYVYVNNELIVWV